MEKFKFCATSLGDDEKEGWTSLLSSPRHLSPSRPKERLSSPLLSLLFLRFQSSLSPSILVDGPPIIFPSNLHDLESDGCDDIIRLSVEPPISISSFSPSQPDEFIKGVVFNLSDKDLFCIEEQDIFDHIYYLVKDFSHLSPNFKFNLVESLLSNLSVLLPNFDSLSRATYPAHFEGDMFLDRLASYRNAFKIYTFFLLTNVRSKESNQHANNNQKATSRIRKKQSSNSWNLESQRCRILNLIANSLEINLALLFGSSAPDENYLSFVVKHAFSMFENQASLKDADTKDALCCIIGTCATKYHYIV
ncbi:condensin-1 complex subunit CAP-D2-like [Magnolia sinica]|uniref:condensin-1 complex subunit CAP-D2-like n=1 Tax=Magnolia sinica TaxID=86752 RepID=UPI00265ACFFF|nr:condensin-1 complex subunit CAP-D2-like [Magnolia sinica]